MQHVQGAFEIVRQKMNEEMEAGLASTTAGPLYEMLGFGWGFQLQ